MHWLDRAAGLITTYRRPGLRFFHGGWGDLDLLEKYRTRVRYPPDRLDLEVTWQPERDARGMLVRDGTFLSPVEDLPDASRLATVRLVLPAGPCRRLALLIAAWNDHSFATRESLARRLATVHGIGSLLLEHPYFGGRRPHEARLHPIGVVSDFMVMGRAAVEEGLALLRHHHELGLTEFGGRSEISVGVAGYSMGANLAGFVSATADFPLATALFAPAHSPGPVVMHGAINAAVDWAALDDRPDPREALADYLGNVSIIHFPPPDHVRHAVLVVARGDGFVPPEVAEDLHRHWPGSELRWIREGHATMLLLRKPTWARAIVDSFDRLEAG